MASTTLHEFLIKLGFSVDPASSKRFNDQIANATKSVNALRLGILGLAVGVEEALRRTTNSFEKLFYLSRSTGVAAKQIALLRAEFVGAGEDASAADAAIQNFTKALLTPGTYQQATTLVGPFRDAKDFIDKAAKRYHDLVQMAHGDEMAPAVLAFRTIAQSIQGVDFDSMIRIPGLNWDRATASAQQLERVLTRIFGSDENIKKATQSAADMQQQFWQLGQVLELSVARFFTDPKISAAIEKVTKAFSEWLIKPETIKAFQDITDAIGDWLQNPENIEKFKKAMTGLGETLLGIVESFGKIMKAIQWLTDHPVLGGVAAGAATGGVVAGPAGAVVGGVIGGLGGAALDPRNVYQNQWDAAKAQYNADKNAGRDQRGFDQFSREWHAAHPMPSAQHGGIVPINAHAGEMVLPRQISEGLQNLFMHSPGGGPGPGANDNFLSGQVERWLDGDTALRPIVNLADDTFEKLHNLFLDFFDEKTTGNTGAGGGAPGAAPGTPGAPDAPGAAPGTPGAPDAGNPEVGSLSQKALEAIAKGEGTLGPGGIDYNQIYGGKHIDLAHMTLDQVMEYQRTQMGKNTPVGAFQFTRGTLHDTAAALKYDPATTMMTPEVQRQLASELYRERGFKMTWVNPETNAGRTQAEFERLKQSGGLWATGPAIGGGGSPLGTGGGQWSSGGVNMSKVRGALAETLEAAATDMPKGVTVKATAGESQGHSPGSQHHTGNAMDVQIWQDGKLLPNEGQFGGGAMYAKLAHAWYNRVLKMHPELAGAAAWGGEFETKAGSGKADYMHYDFGGYARGGRHRRGDWHYVDNSNNTTVVQGVPDPHGVARATADNHDRRSATAMRNVGRTYNA